VPSLAIHTGRALTPLAEIPDALILVEDGRIRSIGPRAGAVLPPGAREFDARALVAAPGFVDVHIHGAAGRDVMEATPQALAAVAACVVRHGTTAFVATTVSAGVDETLRTLEKLAGSIRGQFGVPGPATDSSAAAECLGVHLEGPFLNPLRRGVHPAEQLIPPSPATLARFLAAAEGFARILTLAPELPGAAETIAAARAAGLVVAMGHTDASYGETQRAVELGARHAVHLFNAMRPFSHRETGVVGAVLTDARVTAEVIADGVHVDDPALRLLLAAKSAESILLVSDGTAATGMPDGSYRLGSIEVTVTSGVCRNREGKIAGSTLTLDRAVRRMVGLGVPLPAALQMASFNPARLLGIEAQKGRLIPGADADIVLLDDALNVSRVFVRGRSTDG
jgi:N-acetylglucosamine-6-phosphate deacetylase